MESIRSADELYKYTPQKFIELTEGGHAKILTNTLLSKHLHTVETLLKTANDPIYNVALDIIRHKFSPTIRDTAIALKGYLPVAQSKTRMRKFILEYINKSMTDSKEVLVSLTAPEIKVIGIGDALLSKFLPSIALAPVLADAIVGKPGAFAPYLEQLLNTYKNLYVKCIGHIIDLSEELAKDLNLPRRIEKGNTELLKKGNPTEEIFRTIRRTRKDFTKTYSEFIGEFKETLDNKTLIALETYRVFGAQVHFPKNIRENFHVKRDVAGNIIITNDSTATHYRTNEVTVYSITRARESNIKGPAFTRTLSLITAEFEGKYTTNIDLHDNRIYIEAPKPVKIETITGRTVILQKGVYAIKRETSDPILII
ncbi:hypothetical protein [Pyrococcus kukulkanii]|uniref:Uncharacterized protein n=1 Tax=Pyrococcus kukulkanii TaxID=1609559 RepID=A0ABV4T5P3_9EURY